jgi:hypothetical protein
LAVSLLVTPVVQDAAIETDRRPVAGGVYDASIQTTFISWMGVNSDSYVQSYSYASGTWSAPKKVGTSTGDSHNYPVMVQANDGRLLVFHGAHNAPLKLATSPNPHSIGGTWTDVTLPVAAAASYPMPVKASNGDIYVFYRETLRTIDGTSPTDTRPLRYLVSTDNGHTWTRSAGTFAIGSGTRTDNLNETYVGQIRAVTFGGVQRFHLVWTIAGGGPGTHLHDNYHKNLYYCAFQPSNRHFYSVTGADLGTAIDDTEQENSCKVLDTPLVRKIPQTRDVGYVHLVDLLANGTPYLVYTRYTSDTPVVMTAVRSGSTWVQTTGVSGGKLTDMEKTGPDTFRVYVANELAPGVKAYIGKPGLAFAFEQELSTTQAIQHIEVIPGAPNPVRAIATGFSTSDNPADAHGDVSVIGPTCSPATVSAVTASADDGNVAANAVDGNLATRWSASGDGQWIRFDLGASRPLCSASIAFYKGSARRSLFDLQTSDNGSTWTTVLSGQSSGTTDAAEFFALPPVTARYLRYLGHGNTLNAWNSLTEVSIRAGS